MVRELGGSGCEVGSRWKECSYVTYTWWKPTDSKERKEEAIDGLVWIHQVLLFTLYIVHGPLDWEAEKGVGAIGVVGRAVKAW